MGPAYAAEEKVVEEEGGCKRINDDANFVVELSSFFNDFVIVVAKQAQSVGPVLTGRSTMTPASTSGTPARAASS